MHAAIFLLIHWNLIFVLRIWKIGCNTTVTINQGCDIRKDRLSTSSLVNTIIQISLGYKTQAQTGISVSCCQLTTHYTPRY